MIKLNKKLAVLPVLLALGVGYASAAENCAAKRASIEYQISQAKLYGNANKVASLQQALNNVNLYCKNGNTTNNTTNTATAATKDKAQQKVASAEKKLLETKDQLIQIQTDLRQARIKGDTKKIIKLEKKISEKQADMTKAQKALNEARAELNRLK